MCGVPHQGLQLKPFLAIGGPAALCRIVSLCIILGIGPGSEKDAEYTWLVTSCWGSSLELCLHAQKTQSSPTS